MLALRSLAYAYGRRRVLHGVDAEWAGGQVVGLLGPNGSGKSTLVSCLAGVRTPSGEALLDGVPVARARDRIGYLPQDLPGRAALCALESVLVASRRGPVWRTSPAEVDRAWGALESVGVAELADRPLGELSGGQRQLVGLAQTLVRDPDLLLLDEPTSALDLRHQVAVLDRVRRVVRERGGLAVVALHDLNLAGRFCDRLAVLAEGRVVADGAPAEVLTPELVGAVYGVRARIRSDGDGVLVVPEAA